jgi:maltose alpha-D-glucosyltransferase/alpha-amylase
VNEKWTALLQPAARARLARLLLEYVLPRRWFRSKSRTPRGAEIADLIPLDGHSDAECAREPIANWLALLAIAYDVGAGDLYLIPLTRVDGARAETLRRTKPHAIIVPLAGEDGAASEGAMVDGLATGQAAHSLLDVILAERGIRGLHGSLRGESFPEASALGRDASSDRLAVTVPDVEQTNSTLLVGEHLLKIYRQVSAGPSPELEVGRFLTAHCDPPCAPRVLGALSYETFEGELWNVGIAHEYLANDGDAWSLALRELRAYFERASDAIADGATSPPTERTAIAPLVGRFQTLAQTLGRRTGQLHLALAGSNDGNGDPRFAPEPLTPPDRLAMVERSEAMLQETLSALEKTVEMLGPEAQAIGESLRPDTNARARLTALLRRSLEHPLSVVKTRIHGDLHLGQVLSRGDDFVIIDFEGEPTRPLDERRAKTSPLRDVTAMARSFDYAAEAVLREVAAGSERGCPLEPWALLWTREVTAAYLNAYLATVQGSAFIPKSAEDLQVLLTFHELEKVIYELAYEINNRPDWIEIPLRGLARLAVAPASNGPPLGEAPNVHPSCEHNGNDHA